MGRGMVRNLLAAGYPVQGFNRTPGRDDTLVAQGMTRASTPVDAAEGASVLIACLGGDEALESVVVDAALAQCATGTLVIDCGTTSVSLTDRLALECEDRGLPFVAAPITGSKLGAEGGKLTIMAAGASAAVGRARPLFDVMGKKTVACGETPRDAQHVKACLNMSQAIILQGVLEGYALAQAGGVSPAILAEVMEHSAGKTGVGMFKTPYLFRGDFEEHFKLSLMQKDLHLALGQASDARLPLPLARAVLSIYDQAAAQGLGPEDFLSTAKLLEQALAAPMRTSDGEETPD